MTALDVAARIDLATTPGDPEPFALPTPSAPGLPAPDHRALVGAAERAGRTMGTLVRLAIAWSGLALVAFTSGYLLVGAANLGPAKAWDTPVARALTIGHSSLASPIADLTVGLVSIYLIAVTISIARERSSRWSGIEGLALSLAGSYALVVCCRKVFARPALPSKLNGLASTQWAFPSMVVALAATTATTAAIGPRRRGEPLRPLGTWGLVLAAAVGLVQMVVGVHWLTDVVVGFAIGVTWAVIVRIAMIHRDRPVRPPMRIAAKWARAASVLVILLVVSPVGYSYAGALTFPGNAGWASRSVDWLRSNGGGGLVDSVENFWYARTPPPEFGRPPLITNPFGTAFPRSAPSGPVAPPVIATPVRPLVAHEGEWVPGPVTSHGRPVLYTAQWRSDPGHTGVVVSAIWFDSRLLRPQVVAGTKEPGGHWPWGARIPQDLWSSTVAAVNGGFRFHDSRGGFYQDHKVGWGLQPGAASLIVYKDGRVDIDAWPSSSPDLASINTVRQNLGLIVEGGKAVDGLDRNAGDRWGDSKNQLQYTWRSGLGVDRNGNLVYVAGDQLNLEMLAQALQSAGAVRAMQLDIHPGMVHAELLETDPLARYGESGRLLLEGMEGSSTRYFEQDERDFIALRLR
jgi:membrane-associated phospholipid phosphatase